MKPYYDHAGITIYHGDCLAVMDALWPCWGERPFDLLLTDPPYGIGVAKTGMIGSRTRTQNLTGYGLVQATQFEPVTWDGEPPNRSIAEARKLCEDAVIWGGNYFDLPPSRCWLVWDKQTDGTDFADAELAWTSFNRAVRRIIYRWNGMLQQPGRPKEKRVHPTQKPEAVMVWALGLAPASVRTVFDPFMGSGTTLVAAKRLGKQAVGIEREERYCEIAAERLAQEALPLDLGA